MVASKKGNMLGLKRLNKKEKLKQLALCFVKFLENSSPKDDVESKCDVHL